LIDQIHHLLEESLRQDSAILYFLMFGGGLLTSITPCTYPVLPLTVGYIGNQADAKRWRSFLLSLSMVTGLASVYALLGIIVAAVGGTFGSIMGNGLILYAIAMFYLLMGLFMLDVFKFPTLIIFSSLQAKSTSRKGMVGAFVIGGVGGLIVGPCTGPIIAMALGAIAMTLKNVSGVDFFLQAAKGGILLFLFGLGQGALILLAGTFTGFLYKLPKAGVWMENVKKGFALLVIVTASLLFVFVGQNTDFPSLTKLLANPESSPTPALPTDISGAPVPRTSSSGEPEAKVVLEPLPIPAAKTAPVPGTDLPIKPRSQDVSVEALPIPAANSAPSLIPKANVPLNNQSREANSPPAKTAPDFTLSSLGKGKVTLSHLKGRKGVVLVFFATWCVNCMKEVPEIKHFAEKARTENIAVFGIDYKQSEEIAERFKKSMHINYEILLDSDGTVATDNYGLTGIPHVVGINGKGEMIYRGTKLPDNKDEFMRNLKNGL
jgi:thiol:disulfide interchange protein DsbD